MKDGAFIINTGRGALLDTERPSGRLGKRPSSAARRWMSSKARKGSSTPTTDERPVESRLLLRLHQLPNVIITPHTAYYTDHTLSDIVENTLSNCLRFEGTSGMDRLRIAIIFGGCLRRTPHLGQICTGGGKRTSTSKRYEPFYVGITKGGVWKLCDSPDTDWEERAVAVRRCSHRTAVCTDYWSWIRGSTGRFGWTWCFPCLHGRLGRGRGDAGLAGAFRHPLRRLRCPELSPVHGQVSRLPGGAPRRSGDAELLGRRRRARTSIPTGFRIPSS